MIQDIQKQTGATLRLVCRTLEVPRSSFYQAARETRRQADDRRIGVQIEEIFRVHRRRYGHRRIWHELADQQIVCAPSRIRRIMKQRGLRAIQPRHFVPKTSDGKASKPSPNLLVGKPNPDRPNQVWTGDITYVPTQSGWLYMAVVMDLYSRRILGWKLDDNLRSDLVTDAMKQAIKSRPGCRGVIFHSDRGSQYGSQAFRKILRDAGVVQSMSAIANPYDNAWTESFIGTFKKEMLQGGQFYDRHDAQMETFEYIDGYYNNHRKHSALQYSSPAQFEHQPSQRN